MSRWTDGELRILIEGFAKGDSDAWTSGRTGHTKRAVELKRRGLGLLVRPVSRSAVRDYATETLADELRRRGFRVLRTPAMAPKPTPPERATVDASRWSVRGSIRVKGATQRGVTHTVHGNTPNAARRAWAKAVRATGGDPLMPSASVRLIEGSP